jgi:hypothetical protein
MSAFEFIYITDTHFFHKTPPSRTDDYLETGIEKLDWVILYANDNKIRHIIHGGDFFGRTAGDTRFLSWGAWNRIAETIGKNPHLHWHVNVGQHDLSAHAADSLPTMPLGCLRNMPNFWVQPNTDRKQLGFAGERPVFLICRWFDFHRSKKPSFYAISKKLRVDPDEILILTAHGLLVDKPFLGDYVLVRDIGPSEADIFLASDYHPGWPDKAIGHDIHGAQTTTNYIAPGSLLRPEKPGAERMPQLMHVTIGENREIFWKGVSVTNKFPFKKEARPVAREHVVEDEESYQGVMDKLTEETKSVRFVNPVDYVTQIAAAEKVSDAVRTYTLGFVEKAQETLGAGKER